MLDQILFRVEDSAKLLDVSRATLYELIRDGRIESVKIGRSRRITREALERYVTSLQGSTPASSDAA